MEDLGPGLPPTKSCTTAIYTQKSPPIFLYSESFGIYLSQSLTKQMHTTLPRTTKWGTEHDWRNKQAWDVRFSLMWKGYTITSVYKVNHSGTRAGPRVKHRKHISHTSVITHQKYSYLGYHVNIIKQSRHESINVKKLVQAPLSMSLAQTIHNRRARTRGIIV